MKQRTFWTFLAAFAVALTGCEQELDGPKPTVDDPVAGSPLPVDPGILCRMQHPDAGTPVVVHGEGFSPVPYDVPKDPKLALPTVTLSRQLNLDGTAGDGATVIYDGEPDGSNSDLLSWESREQMTFRLVDEVDLDGGTVGPAPMGVHDVQITNANDNEATSVGSFAVVDRPYVDGVEPDVICVAQSPRIITLTGQSILRLGDDFAVVRIDDQDFPVDTMSGCVPIPHDGLEAELCDEVTAVIPQDALIPGLYEVLLANPDPAGCVSVHSEDQVELLVVPPPAITQAEPSLMCTDDGSKDLVISGSGFIEIDGTGPTVALGGTAVAYTSLGGCITTTVNGTPVRECDTINLTVPQGTLSAGAVEVAVTNPAPAGCTISDSMLLTAPPELTLASAEPNGVCGAAGTIDVTVNGSGFLRVAGVGDFAVTVAGTPATPSSITNCVDLTVDRMSVQSCDTFVVAVDTSALALGPVAIGVDNPTVGACDLTSSTIFAIAQQPTITDIVPTEVCENESTTLVISGTNLLPSAQVVAHHTTEFTNVPADSVVDAGGGDIAATWNGGLDPGLYDITVVNAPTCEDTAFDALTVDPLPFVFFVDPPTVYNDITNQVTIYTSGLPRVIGPGSGAVELINSGGTHIPLTTFSSAGRPNRILATIPSVNDVSSLVAGTYEVAVTSDIGCVSSLNGTLDITATPSLTVSTVDPGFVGRTESTAVSITGTGFVSTPRVYLNPPGGGTATALDAVEFITGAPLSAVIPGGLDAGSYDVIVVNPTGEVGILSDGLTVVDAPPVVEAISPGSMNSNATNPATIFGQNFNVAGVQLSADCRLPGGSPTSTNPTVTVTGTITATEIPVSVVSSADQPAGTVCIVHLTNAPTGAAATFEYSAISFKTSSDNLTAFSAGTSLFEARRGHGLIAGRPTNTSRFLYAIGGDDGSLANAKTSVEAVSVSVFGVLDTWEQQVNSLPEARTMAGAAQVGRFIYLVGGHDGASAVDTVLRAEILDPLEGPEIVDVDAALAETGGLTPGLWIYRVSATFPGTDIKNPDGESLAGDVFNVQIPAIPTELNAEGLILTLTWDSVAGASGYRLYRTPAAGDAASDVELLAVTTDPSYTDSKDDTTGEFPLPSGSLGTWHTARVSAGDSTPIALNTPRRSPATVSVQDPDNPDHWLLYAFGGEDASSPTPALLDSYEVIEIDVQSDASHVVTAAVEVASALTVPRYAAAAWTATNRDTTAIGASEVAVFIGGGGDVPGGAAGATADTRGGTVNFTTGAVTLGSVTNQPQRAGSAYAAANGFLYLFGGLANGGGLAGDNSCDIVSATELGTWSAPGGGGLAVQRSFPAAAKESAFFYVVGGADAGGAALKTVEQTVQ